MIVLIVNLLFISEDKKHAVKNSVLTGVIVGTYHALSTYNNINFSDFYTGPPPF